MPISHVNENDPLSASKQNALIDQSNANVGGQVTGAGWGTGIAGIVQGFLPRTAIRTHFGKTDSSLAEDAGSYVTVSVWVLNSDETAWEDSGNNIEKVYAPPLQEESIDSSAWVQIMRFPDGRWYVVAARCP
jgi:hypothetical protein